MNPTLPDVAVELATSAMRSFAALGAVDMARRAEADPASRRDSIEAVHALGVDDIDIGADLDALAAGAALCEAAGRVVLPCPVPALLLRSHADGRPFAVVPAGRCRVDHGSLFTEWRVAGVDGRTYRARPVEAPLATKLGPFVTDLECDATVAGTSTAEVARYLALVSWQVLGTCSRAIELAIDHVATRVQFGKPLAALQAVQFQLADAHVAVAGLRELALHTLWRIATVDDALVDALALRVHALDVARQVLRACQQLHGAAGLCDEYDISILYRHVQPALRLPSSAERAATELAIAIDRHGFEGLFAHGADLHPAGAGP